MALKPLLKPHPPYATMVKEALGALDSRKGVTPQAIRNYIKKNYPSVDQHRLTYLVRRVLAKKVDSGELLHLENPKLSGSVKKYRVPAPPALTRFYRGPSVSQLVSVPARAKQQRGQAKGGERRPKRAEKGQTS